MEKEMDQVFKKCSSCKKEFPLSEFYKSKSKPLGVDCYCKKCSSEKRKKKRPKHFIDVNRTHKICPRCNRDLSIDNFYKSKSRPDRHNCNCKNCSKERNQHRIKSERELLQRKLYGKSETYKKAREKYLISEKGKQMMENHRENNNRANRVYNQTEKGREVSKKCHKKRIKEGKVALYAKKGEEKILGLG